MKVTISFPDVKIDPSALSKAKLLEICKQEALVTMASLRDDTGKGKDADGGSLKPYSPAYAKKKADSGRGTVTNLTYTGELLGAMQVRQVPDGAEIFFLGDHKSKSSPGGKSSKLANAALAAYLVSKGFVGWFNWGAKRIKAVEDRFRKEVEEAVKKLVVVQK